MYINFEKLTSNIKIIWCSNLSCDEKILEILRYPFNDITAIIKASDFIRIVSDYHLDLFTESIHELLNQLNNFINENNDIWIGLD